MRHPFYAMPTVWTCNVEHFQLPKSVVFRRLLQMKNIKVRNGGRFWKCFLFGRKNFLI
jgi:hypothetical protein